MATDTTNEYSKVVKAYKNLLKTVKQKVPDPEIKLVQKAFRFSLNAHASQKRLSGEPYIIHPLAVAQILADQGLDTPTICAALLHDVVEDTAYGEEYVTREFGAEITALVKAATKISAVKKKGVAPVNEKNTTLSKEKEAAENIRTVLLATTRDVRVILLKLADKLHNMRTLEFHRTDKIKRIAEEVINIYAPIAGRLGMFRLKSELEDLAFINLLPEEYNNIEEGITQSRDNIESFINKISKILQQRLSEINIKAKMEGRVKHHYSIYKKMVLQGKQLEEIYDLRGIRIIVNDIRDCYGVLGIVHTLWPPIQGRFKDYIATPRANGYQSLHTTVIGPDGIPLEIQIRTHAMNEVADHGIAAHWIYKNDTSQTDLTKLRWLQKLSNLTENPSDTSIFIEDLRQELSPHELYVFTPKGDIIDLPKGSTVLDFAFHIHTEIGLRCKSATVNDQIVPLRTELKSGDRVRIICDKNPRPSPGWLRYIKSPRIKQKLRSHFRRIEEAEMENIRREEKKQKIKQAASEIEELRGMENIRIRRKKTSDPKQVPIEIVGEKDIPVRYAGCCSPVPGNRIVGFYTRERGLTVHRADCAYLHYESEEEKKRIIQLGWEGLTEKYPVTIEVKAEDYQGLYLDIVGEITRSFTNILKAEADLSRTGSQGMVARFLIEVEHIDHLNEILEGLRNIPGVFQAERVSEKKPKNPPQGAEV